MRLIKVFLLFSLLCSGSGKIAFAQKADNTVDSLIQSLTKNKEDSLKADKLNLLSKKLWQQNDFTGALDYANKALALSIKIKYAEGVASAYNKLGIIYKDQGNYPEALKNDFASLKIQEQLGNKLHIAYSYSNIGNIYFRQENYGEALNSYFASLKIEEQLNDTPGIAVCYNDLGSVYRAQGNLVEALKTHTAAMKIRKELGDKEGMSLSYNNIGNVYWDQNNFPDAIKSYLAALAIDKEIGFKKGIAVACINLGELYSALNKRVEAREYVTKGLQLALEMGGKNEIVAGYNGLAQLDSITGNYKEAYKYQHLYSELRGQMLNEESNKEISKLKILYETEKKDREIEAMNKDRLLKETEIKRQRTINNAIAIGSAALMLIAILSFLVYRNNRRIKETELKHQISDVEMKSLRSQLNPHFIFNAMTTTQSMFEKDKNEGGIFLNEYSNFLRNILNSSEASEHSIDSEIKLIQAYFNIESARFEHSPELSVVVEEGIDRYAVLIPSLLLQPLVENAIKYCLSTNDGNGSVQIVFKRKENGLICRVEDRGLEDTYHPVSFDEKFDNKPHGVLITRKRLELFNKKYKYKGAIFSEPLHPGTAIVLELAYYDIS